MMATLCLGMDVRKRAKWNVAMFAVMRTEVNLLIFVKHSAAMVSEHPLKNVMMATMMMETVVHVLV
jgi:hypothetical protein